METAVPISAQPTFVDWVMQYGQIIAFFAQLIYWLGILVLLFYAVWQYKRWVNFQLGTGRSGKLRSDVAEEAPAAEERAVASAEKPSVEEFVE